MDRGAPLLKISRFHHDCLQPPQRESPARAPGFFRGSVGARVQRGSGTSAVSMPSHTRHWNVCRSVRVSVGCGSMPVRRVGAPHVAHAGPWVRLTGAISRPLLLMPHTLHPSGIIASNTLPLLLLRLLRL